MVHWQKKLETLRHRATCRITTRGRKTGQPHAVTIWCAQVDGQLFVGASAPQTKRWPGWVDRNPDVRLRIGEQIFAVRLVALDDATVIAQVQAAYAAKYQLAGRGGDGAPEVRYWRVSARPGVPAA